MSTRQNQNKNQEHIHYCDLSSNLDSKLRFFSDLAQATDPEKIIFDDCMAEFGESVIEYLGKRTLLEHVFFGRTLTRVQLEDADVKAELWRLRKIKAGLSLKPKT